MSPFLFCFLSRPQQVPVPVLPVDILSTFVLAYIVEILETLESNHSRECRFHRAYEQEEHPAEF